MTSAPKSAIIVVDTGPAMKLAASITRMPSRKRAMVRPPGPHPITKRAVGLTGGVRRGHSEREVKAMKTTRNRGLACLLALAAALVLAPVARAEDALEVTQDRVYREGVFLVADALVENNT